MSFRKSLPKPLCLAVAAFSLIGSAHSADLNLQNVPLYLLSRADPNVLLEMSVETPMGGAAYNDQSGNPAGCGGRVTVDGHEVGRCYIPATTYLGYFNSKRCYDYSGGQFNPVATANATTHACSTKWSGNFLNWATMTAVDMFVLTMTGGNRTVDSATETVVKRARKTDNDSWFPTKIVRTSGTGSNVAPNTVTQFSSPSTIYIYNTAWGFQVGTTYDKARQASPDLGSFNVRARVCDKSLSTTTLESNCVAYGSGASTYYKPEGLIQANALQKRFAVMSYSFDNAAERDGGVLRSNMKYVGPKLPDGSNNTQKEYGTNGLYINNPDGATGGLNSGVINYVNQFSEPGYKNYDPIGELFYESLRFFKHIGRTPEYANGLTTAQCGGFQVLTAWEDPMKYRCQKNFIIAINDANPWLDKKLPGTYFTSSTLMGAAGFTPHNLGYGDYGQPSNPDPDINVTSLTNRVGDLEGLNGITWANSGTWTSGSQSGTLDSVGGGLGSWNNSCSDKFVGKLGEVMGTCPYPPKENSYYVAGLAYYANTNDLRSDLANDRGIQNVQSFVIDTQEFQSNPLDGPRNMLWLAGKYGGFVDAPQGETPPDGVPQTSEWDADGDGAPDNYVLATRPTNLVSGLNRAFDFINKQTSSASSASVNSGSISSDTRVYQALFNSTDWTGQLLAKPVGSNGALGTLDWNAAAELPAAGSRKIFTVNSDGSGVPFRWVNLDTTRRAQLQPVDTQGSNRVSYLRGDQTNEAPSGTFRRRASPVPGFTGVNNRLGDIINSEPAYVGKPPFLYKDPSYVEFRDDNADRTPMVYVGANDGMLHAFNASTTGSNKGDEVFAFVPGTVFRNLIELTKPSYSHQYYVDGSPTTGDVKIGSNWRTMLVAGLNKGGQGVYALDVTNPTPTTESGAAAMFKWEFTDADDPDLGYTFSRPAIVKLHNGKWAAVFGNGYNNTFDDTASGGQRSTTGNAVLYLVDIETGEMINSAPISTGKGTAQDPLGQNRPNGLGTPAVVDINGDSVADYAFAGDLFGDLWKFDLTSNDPALWRAAYTDGDGNPAPLFKATDASGKPQPITERPEIGRGPNGRGMIVLFGTGKFIEPVDKDLENLTDLTRQAFYGIIDPATASSTPVASRNDLQQQQITIESTATFAGKSVAYRVTTENAIAAGKRGWYLDLLSGTPGVPPTGMAPDRFRGEMSVSDPILRNGRVIFTTLIPTADVCLFGGTSWLMELDALSGARLPYTPFDLNDDTKFNEDDYVTLEDGTKVPVSGVLTDVGITAKPGVLSANDAEYKYMSGTAVSAATGTNMGVIRENPGPNDTGRQSWRQMR